MIRNGNDDIAPRIADIIRQGIQAKEFRCDCPDEISEVLILLLTVWLDPVITQRNPQEVNKRLDFLFKLLEHFETQLFQPEDIVVMKKLYGGFTTGGERG